MKTINLWQLEDNDRDCRPTEYRILANHNLSSAHLRLLLMNAILVTFGLLL